MINLKEHKAYFIKIENGKALHFYIAGSPFRYYLSFEGNSNQVLFTMLNIDKDMFTRQTLGYYSSASWPWCRTIEDVNRLLFALLKEIKDRGYNFICNFNFEDSDNYWID